MEYTFPSDIKKLFSELIDSRLVVWHLAGLTGYNMLKIYSQSVSRLLPAKPIPLQVASILRVSNYVRFFEAVSFTAKTP
jgi:hypothetical protein